MNTIEPTIGRIVWFNPTSTDDELPAIITHVWSNDCINIQVFSNNLNGSYLQTSVMYDDDTNGRTWRWMPYQKAQAEKAKTE